MKYPHLVATARNLGTDTDPDWRGSCLCGWGSSSGRATVSRPARTEVRAKELAAQHAQVAPRRDGLLVRLDATALTEDQAAAVVEELRRLENARA